MFTRGEPAMWCGANGVITENFSDGTIQADYDNMHAIYRQYLQEICVSKHRDWLAWAVCISFKDIWSRMVRNQQRDGYLLDICV